MPIAPPAVPFSKHELSVLIDALNLMLEIGRTVGTIEDQGVFIEAIRKAESLCTSELAPDPTPSDRAVADDLKRAFRQVLTWSSDLRGLRSAGNKLTATPTEPDATSMSVAARALDFIERRYDKLPLPLTAPEAREAA